MNSNQLFEAPMRLALELALNGPAWGVNPQVGAVILDVDNNVISTGWHEGAGTDHAEVMALKKLGVVPAGATAVVTLEPCNHTGRTGPCAQALIAAGISRVVYASTDPGSESGHGADTLREAGIEVIGGVLEAAADYQNRVWLKSKKLGRPFITLKWASTLDGRAAANDGTSQWITGPEARADVHKVRSEIDAILVGTSTVLADNPTLTARKNDGSLYQHQPLRVIVGETEIQSSINILNADAPTIQLRTRVLLDVLADLQARDVKHLLVEGGPTLMSQFIRLGLVDEYQIYLAPMLLGGERTAIDNIGVSSMPDAKHLSFDRVEQIGSDLKIYASPKVSN